jgi:hypothetical protein
MRPYSFALVTLALLFFVPRTEAAGSKGPAFVCTQVTGVSVTGDWFNAGFESGNDDARWQAVTRNHAFIELWGDPKDAVWQEKVVSPCAKRSDRPDRVILMAVNWQFTTADEWVAALTKAVKTTKAKYPGLKNLELLTMLRGPGNKTCGDPKTVVQPFIDEAVAKVAAAFPKLVTVGPKFEAPSCDVFVKGGPHFTDDGMARVANVYASHYLK